MKEEMKQRMQTILDYYYTGSDMPDIIILHAMESAYRAGWMDCLEEQSKDEEEHYGD